MVSNHITIALLPLALRGVGLVSTTAQYFNLPHKHFTDYKFDLLYSKRAFVHWYVGEGMEEVSCYILC